MGQIVLQMMISLDGMVSGPKGELDWIAEDDEPLNQDHLTRLRQADVLIMGANMYPGLTDYWEAAAKDKKMKESFREIGKAMSETNKIVYSHKNLSVKGNTKLHKIADDKGFVEDVERLKRKTKGLIVTYGGIRFARSLLQLDLLDEIHLDVCPIILSDGQPLFTDLKHRTKLRLHKSVTYNSGATMLHYKVSIT